MIKEFEIHLLTKKDLSDIEKAMQEMGLKYTKKLVEKGIIYHVVRNNKIAEIMLEFYKETENGIEYKFKTDNLEDFNFVVEFAKKL